MAVTITGGKYSGSITSVGTTTRVIDSSASFSSGDFSSPRIIGLWSSGGTYKGVAWVRQRISGTEIEIEQEFIDSTGATVTQTSGDTYLVSKNYADVATTGITVSGKSVTLTDAIIFGTSGSSNSVCFYDEDVLITSSAGSNAAMEFRGGLVVHGHLLNYVNRSTSNGVTLLIKGSGAGSFGGNQFKITDTAAKVWWLGGAILSEASPSRLIGHSNDSTICTPAEWQKYWGVAVNCDIISPGDGAAWSSLASKQEIVNLRSAVSGTNAIALRWGDGVIEGGSFRLTGSDAISLFGADASGSFSIGAPPGQFIEVSDLGIGSKPALWRSATFVNQNISWTNVVTPNRKHGEGVNPGSSANNNATGTFYFSGTYTNLVSGSLAVIKNNNLLSSVATSATVSGTTQTLTIQESVVTGHTEAVTESAWAYAFWAHGYNPVTGTFATSTVSLGPAGSAKKVQLGDAVAQVADVNITQSNRAAVLAYSSFSTLDQLYDRAQAWKTESSANAIYPTLTTRLIDVSTGRLAPATSLTLDSSAGSAFAVNTGTGTTTIKGSSLSAGAKFTTLLVGTSKTLTFAQNGTIGFHIDVPATGTVKVTSGTTTFTPDSVFESGATIDNTSASPATVIVNSSQVANITTTSTGGGSITVSAVPTYLSAANFAEGTRVQVVHRQVFIVASTAINTTTNAITLGNDSNGDTASLSTSTPRSLVRFAPTSGATIPTTSPQIIDGGLYYVASNSAGVITLSVTSGGSAIDFSSQGSGDFQLIAETELDNSLVGSSDYSLAIARSTGALIRVKARYWQNSSGCTASEFFDQVYVWSSTGGVTIPDVVSDTALPDSIHNRIISISTLELPVSGSVSPTSDGSGVSGLTFALEGTGKIQINANDADGVLLIQDLYAWGVYISSTEAGIRLASASTFVADDLFNYQVLSLEFDNTGTIPLRIIGGRITDESGVTPIASTTSASIFPNVELIGTGAIVSGGGGATAADIWSYGIRSLTTTIPSASDNAAAVWAADTRILTSGANIVLAKGVGITGLNDLALATIEGSTVLAKQSAVLAIPTNPLLASNYTAPDNAGISTLLTRLSAARAGYLDLVPSIDSRTTDLSDLRGYTDGVTVTIDTTSGTIATSNGKRVRVSTSGLTRTIERDDP